MRFLLLLLFVTGCATNSGVIPTGKNSYLVFREGSSSFSKPGLLRVEALKEAANYCVKEGKKMNVISVEDGKPPFILGNYPKSEVKFTCEN